MRSIVFLLLVACGPDASGTPPTSPAFDTHKPVEDAPKPVTPKVSTPSDLALSCKTDDECQGHKCNTKVGKCSYPCASDLDCTNGGTCQPNGAPGMAVCSGAKRR